MPKRFLLGFATGYVLGARAGRKRYEQLTKLAERVMSLPFVDQLVGAGREVAGDRVHQLITAVGQHGDSGDSDGDGDGDSSPGQGRSGGESSGESRSGGGSSSGEGRSGGGSSGGRSNGGRSGEARSGGRSSAGRSSAGVSSGGGRSGGAGGKGGGSAPDRGHQSPGRQRLASLATAALERGRAD